MLRRLDPDTVRRRDAARALEAFVGDDKPRRKPRVDLAQKREEIDRLMRSDPKGKGEAWRAAKPSTFVALYARWHEQLYRVAPGELRGRALAAATVQAARVLRDEFDGDGRRLFRFVAWAFARERSRQSWRRGADSGRLTWQRLFASPGTVTDFRVAVASRA